MTPGKVVYRNRLIELIQYAPATAQVRPEPVLIVPAWIMKYYILDLSPHNSLVKYLTEQGYTVFMISWKNPGPADRDLSMEDYRTLGVMAALDAVSAIVKGHTIHAVGYCIGGTLLAIAAAAMARDGDNRLKSATFFAAQTDFTEAGELMLFINESQLAFLEDVMWEQGFLDSRQMAGTFQMLRSNDLIWSRMVRTYLMGEREVMTDLNAWNADATRMPYRQHAEYLRRLVPRQRSGRRPLSCRRPAGRAVRYPRADFQRRNRIGPRRAMALGIQVQSAHRYRGHVPADERRSQRRHRIRARAPQRHYRVATKAAEDHYVDPDVWLATTPVSEGSWWPEWVAWLDARSGARGAPPKMGAAPGRIRAGRRCARHLCAGGLSEAANVQAVLFGQRGMRRHGARGFEVA